MAVYHDSEIKTRVPHEVLAPSEEDLADPDQAFEIDLMERVVEDRKGSFFETDDKAFAQATHHNLLVNA